MTENEAIKILKNNFPKTCKMVDGRYKGGFDDTECEFGQALLLSISVLEEIQQYRAIGTVEEIKEILQIISDGQDDLDESGISTGLLHTLLEYAEHKKIGTVEECREARERQSAKKPNLCMNEVSGMFVDYADGHGEYKTQMNNWWRCPYCNKVVGQRVIVHKHIHDQRKKKFCENCGQAIDWSE